MLFLVRFGKSFILRCISAVVGRLIVVYNNRVAFAWEVQRGILAVEKRSKRNVPRSHAGIIFDNNAMKIWHEENVRDEKNTKECPENNTNGSPSTKVFQRRSSRRLNCDEQRKNSTSKSKVNRDSSQSLLKRILTLQNTEFQRSKKDSRKSSR